MGTWTSVLDWFDDRGEDVIFIWVKHDFVEVMLTSVCEKMLAGYMQINISAIPRFVQKKALKSL